MTIVDWMRLQDSPIKALEWVMLGLLNFYILTFFDEFRYVTISPAVKVKDRRVSDGMVSARHHGPEGGFVPGSFTAPQGPMYSMHSPGVMSVGGIQSISTGRYIYGPRGGLIWVPSKGP